MNHLTQVIIPSSAKGKRLSVYLAEEGYPITADCGGRGTCGKCAVTLVSGRLTTDAKGVSPAIPDSDGNVLSCRVFCTDTPTVIILSVAEGTGLTSQVSAEATVTVSECGVALDIGTTTLAAALVSLKDGAILRTTSRLNPQKSFGADVMSRISVVMEDRGHLALMQKLILDAVRHMILELTGGDSVSHMTVAGNPTMLHLFCGISPEGMGTYPFTPAFTEAKILAGDDLTLPAKRITLLPSISAFIGGDITAGILAKQITDHREPVLLVDMGTNGEMILYTGQSHDGKLYGTSTAAGPALEGAGISTGVGGISGAVSSVQWNGIAMVCKTIHHASPIGICGSGLIDLVSVLLERGIIDETGYLEEDPFTYAHELNLTGADIRAFQLAKSALRAGMEVLCEAAGISPHDLAHIYIAGGLGHYMKVDSAVRVGLLPDCPPSRMVSVGNTALLGAAMLLHRPALLGDLTRAIAECEIIDLNLSPSFSDQFMEHMMFPCTDE
ncbi:MAG: DUF4445 domain-containing protein [Ruminococcaceae bacterium]|nr:DUF4445 domain-containing protein [Oscillospiraceae bacterium]